MATRPLPEPTPVTAPFWEACKAHLLLLQQCETCGHIQFYPRSLCTACMSDDLRWRPARGRGTVYSYSTVHRALLPGFEEDLPYVVAMIELEEGVRLDGVWGGVQDRRNRYYVICGCSLTGLSDQLHA